MKYFAVNLTVSDIFYVLLNINYLPKLILQIQWKCTVRGITYVCIVRICDSRKFMYNKSFLKKLLKKLVVHICTLLLTPFAFELVDYSRHSESLTIRKNSEIDDIFLRYQRFVDFQTYFKGSLCLELLSNLDAKGAKRTIKM